MRATLALNELIKTNIVIRMTLGHALFEVLPINFEQILRTD